MPVVKTEKTAYKVVSPDGREEFKTFVKQVKLDPETGIFRILMPLEVAAATGCMAVEAKELNIVLHAYDEAMAEYNSGTTLERKVILYKFSYHLTDANGRRVEPPNFSSNESALTTGFQVGIFTELESQAKSGAKSYKYIELPSRFKYGFRGGWSDSNPESNTHRGEIWKNRIIWSQEAEDFFFNTQQDLERIALVLKSVDNPGTLQEQIDGGAGMLRLSSPRNNPDA